MTKVHAHVEITYTNEIPPKLLASLHRVETLVADEIRRLFKSLGLDGDLLDLGFAPDGAANDGAVAVTVGGDPCGTCRVDAATTVGGLASAIFALVYANRDALVNQDVVLVVWERFAAKPVSPISAEASRIGELIRRAILFGCPLAEPLRQYEQMLEDDVDEPLRAAAMDPLVSKAGEEVAVFVPKPVQQWNYSEEAQKIREEVFYRSGVTIGPVVLKACERPLQKARGEFRLQQGALMGSLHAAGVLDPADLERAISEALLEDIYLRFSTYNFERTLATFREAAAPMPVFNAVEKLGSNRVVQVLRLLLEERVNIRDLRGILGAMLELNGSVPIDDQFLETYRPTDSHLVPRAGGTPDGPLTDEEFADYVRLHLRHQLCRAISNADTGKLVVHRLSSNVESRLKATSRHRLSAGDVGRLTDAVTNTLGEKGNSGVLLTSFTLRRLLWQTLRRRLPRLRVLCPQELSAHVVVQMGSDVDCNLG